MLKRIASPSLFFCITMFMVFPLCISYALPDPFITPRVMLVAALSLIMMTWFIFKPAVSRGWILSLPVVALGVFLLLYALSISKSLNPGDAWYDWMKTFLALPVMIMSALLLRDGGQRNILLKITQVMVP